MISFFKRRKKKYKEECPRCRGKKGMEQREDHTPITAYLIAGILNLRVRRETRREWVKCWLCKGKGYKLYPVVNSW